MSEHVVVVGAGSWGTTFAAMAGRGAASAVTLVGRRQELVEEITRSRRNDAYVEGLDLPARLNVTTDLEAAADATLLVMAVPAVGFRPAYEAVAARAKQTCATLSLTKGLERRSQLRMTQVVESVSPGAPRAVLTGPNLVPEVARHLPAAAVLASEDDELADRLQRLLSSDRFRIYTNGDVIGCELAATTKNVIAIAAGMCDGMGLGANARASLITRGLAEMSRLGVAMGGQSSTFAGLAGLGDLVATCSSPHSRNRRFGELLALGNRPEDVVSSRRTVAEGAASAAEVSKLASANGTSVPICDTVASVIAGEVGPRDAVEDLMSRQLRPEY